MSFSFYLSIEEDMFSRKCVPSHGSKISVLVLGISLGVSLDFSKVFHTVSHSLLLDKLSRYKLGGWSVRNWLTDCF